MSALQALQVPVGLVAVAALNRVIGLLLAADSDTVSVNDLEAAIWGGHHRPPGEVRT